MFNQSISPMYSFISVSPKNNTPPKKKRQQASKMQKCFILGPPKQPYEENFGTTLGPPKWTEKLPIRIHQILGPKKTYASSTTKSPIKRQVFRCHTQPSKYFHHPTILPKLKSSEDQHRRVGSLRLIEPRRRFTDPFVLRAGNMYIFPEGYVVRNIYICIYNLFHILYTS